MIGRLTQATAGIAAMIGFTAVPAFADVKQEMATAATHAGMAASASDIKMVHMHLHHVVNCIVGPSGDGFDKAAGNPCDGQGNGAMADGGDKTQLAGAVAKAKEGIASDDLAASKKAAGDAQAALTK